MKALINLDHQFNSVGGEYMKQEKVVMSVEKTADDKYLSLSFDNQDGEFYIATEDIKDLLKLL